MENEEPEIDGVPKLTKKQANRLEKELAEYEEENESSLNSEKSKENYERLDAVMSEYLDSYVLVGYSSEGTEVICHRFKNTRDIRSMKSLLEDVALHGYIDSVTE